MDTLLGVKVPQDRLSEALWGRVLGSAVCCTDVATEADVIVVTMSVRWDLSQGLDDGVSVAR